MINSIQIIEAEWRIYAAVKTNHLRHQAIIRANTGILFIGPLGTNYNELLSKIHTFSFKKSAFENDVWQMATILSQPQCVKVLCLPKNQTSAWEPGGRLNIKMSSYQYMDPHVKDKTSYL